MNTPDDYKSKTQIKKEAKALQDLGVKLSRLPVEQLKRMNLPEDLKIALIEAHSIKSNIAGRRQRQYIGALMREVDVKDILQALDESNQYFSDPANRKSDVQDWVDRLLKHDKERIESILRQCPQLERQQLNQLIRNVVKEKQVGKSTKSLNRLKKLVQEHLNL